MGDWGGLPEGDNLRVLNDEHLSSGGRFFSVYPLSTAILWIITDDCGDGIYTQILRPSDA